ncbi:ABC transporter substrate-binding protein [Paenibacillus sp. GP183]|jgi:peptide/nickel transport system substrate-binding protein|uniref:ABC transporter substrate-binding protein n=1 Tax=Paenibacillus sp. GP183 TaxID=1882751 RepID=UPI00089A3A6E|nr:ABC transporter substrate-binding protein [Paenibacillus sp. GP183]SEB51893.1 peptide/nickel transport system substrate-binding protein [Paenibacillus sp. GP183]
MARKKMITTTVVVLLSISVLAGCLSKNNNNAQNSASPGNTASTKTSTGTFKEAPMLEALAKAGTLPAVDQRLPAKQDIMIEPVLDKTGKYGGEWRYPWSGPNDKWGIEMVTEEPLFRFKQDGSGVEPNVAKGYDVNADSTLFTIHLRQGMKWSDGHVFNADDVLFYWEHMLIPETFGKALYDCYYSIDPATGSKERAEVTKVDDYTVQVKFKHSSVQFLERLAIDNKWFFAPAHYYKTVLPEFIGPDKALEVAKQYGFNDTKNLGIWTGYYFWLYPQRPTLNAWVAKNDANSDKFILERNPYFFKTDKDGQQLPYIDRIVMPKMQDSSHTMIETFAGNVELTGADFKDFTVLKENEKKGNYHVVTWSATSWSSTGIELNQTTEAPKLRALFQDIRFREALSVAVDRNQVSEIITNGQGKPAQASVPKGLPNYQDGWDKQWIGYDTNRAAKLFDDIGLKWDSNHKYRTYADGSDLSIVIYEQKGDDERFIELLRKYYDQVGIKTDLKVVDNGSYNDLKYANKIPASIANVSVMNVALRPDELVPLRVITPWFGHYGLYTSSKGKEGVKPEGDVALILEYWDKLKAAKTKEEITKWSNEIVKLHQKNQWVIGYTSPTPVVFIVKNNLKNFPTALFSSDETRGMGLAHPEQFYLE